MSKKKKFGIAAFVVANYLFFIGLSNILDWGVNWATAGGKLLIICSILIIVYYILNGFRKPKTQEAKD